MMVLVIGITAALWTRRPNRTVLGEHGQVQGEVGRTPA